MTPTKPYYRDVWRRVETKTQMSRQQFWKLAQDKPSFNSYISQRYGQLAHISGKPWHG